MNHFSKKEITTLLLLFVGILFSTLLSRNTRLFTKSITTTPGTFEIYLEESSRVDGLVESLKTLEIDFNQDELVWAANTLGWRNYQAGRYLLSNEDSYSEFLSKLGRGIQDPGPVTIVPGIDADRLSKNLSTQLRADSLSFRQIFQDSSEIALEFGLTGEQLMARMLPETYEMYWTSPPKSVVRRIYSEFKRLVIDQYENEIEQNPLSLNEIITLASIVEWEARLNEEKPTISGLYLNRLERNMRLQADPTVLYALGERRRLLYRDYEYDHPYNTYRIRGLPPGPITNPDLNSIRAVLFPEEHDYLYMVATPEGTHRFSETYSEHQQASEEWRQWLREQYRIQREREQESSSDS
ncbi:MAG: endolytic transglycosylase MltG [Balneolaceae bacterium]|nr:endolytic transglycosylase MltG [Balneolaceae bacterium]